MSPWPQARAQETQVTPKRAVLTCPDLPLLSPPLAGQSRSPPSVPRPEPVTHRTSPTPASPRSPVRTKLLTLGSTAPVGLLLPSCSCGPWKRLDRPSPRETELSPRALGRDRSSPAAAAQPPPLPKASAATSARKWATEGPWPPDARWSRLQPRTYPGILASRSQCRGRSNVGRRSQGRPGRTTVGSACSHTARSPETAARQAPAGRVLVHSDQPERPPAGSTGSKGLSGGGGAPPRPPSPS